MAKAKAKPVAEETELDDGTLSMRLKGGQHDGLLVKLDLIVVKLAFEKVETKHKVGAGFSATPEFLKDLCAAAQSAGVTGCTLTMAYQLWHSVAKRWADLGKSTHSTPN